MSKTVKPQGQETRAIRGVEVRVSEGADGKPVVEGYAVLWDSWSEDLGGFRERFMRGAFAKSIEKGDLRVLWQHNGEYVFGRNTAGTAEFEEDDKGLRYRATPPDTQWARDALESIRRGDVTQNSFAFRARRNGDEWLLKDAMAYRTVTDAELYEVGPQTFPAYPDTSVAVRSMREWQESQEGPPAGGEEETPLDELRELRHKLIGASL